MRVNCFLLTDDDRAVEEGQLIFTTVGNVVGQFDGCWANTDGVREIKIIAPDGTSRSVTEYQTQRWTLDPPAQFVDTAPRLVELREIIATELHAKGKEFPKPLVDFVITALASDSMAMLKAAHAAMEEIQLIPF